MSSKTFTCGVQVKGEQVEEGREERAGGGGGGRGTEGEGGGGGAEGMEREGRLARKYLHTRSHISHVGWPAV